MAIRRAAAALPPAAWPARTAGLRAFRLLLGLFVGGLALRFLWRGWLEGLYLQPALRFSYLGLGWIRPWPELWMLRAHVLALAAAGLAAGLGLRPRLSWGLCLGLFVGLEAWDKATYLNHYYLLSLLLGLMWVAAWREPRSVHPPGLPPWLHTVLRLQLLSVWTFAGLAKLQGDWLLRGLPLRLWLPTRADLPWVGPLLALPATALLASWAGAFVDLSAAAGLWRRGGRPWMLLLLWTFHGATGLLFPKIGLFPWLMLAGTLLFLAPSWPRSLGRLLRRSYPARGRAWAALWGGQGLGLRRGLPGSRSGRLAFGLYLALQFLLPLRHLLYPGDLLWTEEGFRFSWRVMLVERSGQLGYRIRRLDGSERSLEARAILTELQAQQAATQPDMILEAAHWLAASEAKAGHPDSQVFADAWVSLNGRSPRRLVDPAVDLARQPWTLQPAPWILRDGS